MTSPVTSISPVAAVTSTSPTKNHSLDLNQIEPIKEVLKEVCIIKSYFDFKIETSLYEIFHVNRYFDVALIGSGAAHAMGAKYVIARASKKVPVTPQRAAEMEEEFKVAPADLDWRCQLPESTDQRELRKIGNEIVWFLKKKSKLTFDVETRQSMLEKIKERFPTHYKDWDWMNINDDRFIDYGIQKLVFDKYKIEYSPEGNQFLIIALNLNGVPHDLIFKVRMVRSYRFPIQALEIPVKNLLLDEEGEIVPTCDYQEPLQPYIDLMEKKIHIYNPDPSDAFCWICNQVRKGWQADSGDRKALIKLVKENYYELEKFVHEFKRWVKVHLRNDPWASAAFILNLLSLAPAGFLNEVKDTWKEIENEDHILPKILKLSLTQAQLYTYLQYYMSLTNQHEFKTRSGTYHLIIPYSLDGIVGKLKEFPEADYPSFEIVCTPSPPKNIFPLASKLYSTSKISKLFATQILIWAGIKNPPVEWLENLEIHDIDLLKSLAKLFSLPDPQNYADFCISCIEKGYQKVVETTQDPEVLKFYLIKTGCGDEQKIEKYFELRKDGADHLFLKMAFDALYKKENWVLCEKIAVLVSLKLSDAQWTKLAYTTSNLDVFYYECSTQSLDCWLVLISKADNFLRFFELFNQRIHSLGMLSVNVKAKLFTTLIAKARKLYDLQFYSAYFEFISQLKATIGDAVPRKDKIEPLLHLLNEGAKVSIYPSDLIVEIIPLDNEKFTESVLKYCIVNFKKISTTASSIILKRFIDDGSISCKYLYKCFDYLDESFFLDIIRLILKKPRENSKPYLAKYRDVIRKVFSEKPNQVQLNLIQELLDNRNLDLFFDRNEISDLVNDILDIFHADPNKSSEMFTNFYRFYCTNIHWAILKPNRECKTFTAFCDYLISASSGVFSITDLIENCLNSYYKIKINAAILTERKILCIAMICFHLQKMTQLDLKKNIRDLDLHLASIPADPSIINTHLEATLEFILLCRAAGRRYQRLLEKHRNSMLSLNFEPPQTLPLMLGGLDGIDDIESYRRISMNVSTLHIHCLKIMESLAQLNLVHCYPRIYEIEEILRRAYPDQFCNLCSSDMLFRNISNRPLNQHINLIKEVINHVKTLEDSYQYRFLQQLFNFYWSYVKDGVSIQQCTGLAEIILEVTPQILFNLKEASDIQYSLIRFTEFIGTVINTDICSKEILTEKLLAAYDFKVPENPKDLQNRQVYLRDFLILFDEVKGIAKMKKSLILNLDP